MTARAAARALLATPLLALLGSGPQTIADAPVAAPDPWASVPDLVASVAAPVIPVRDCPITQHGARAGADASVAIARAIAACSKAGGGRVVVPAGDWPTGPIHLKSRIELHLEAGATLRFSNDPTRYLPPVLTRWEGVELMNYSPLVYAQGAEDVAVTGEGTLDGQADADHWWPWKRGERGQPSQAADRARLFRQAEDGVPVEERVYGAGHFLRPSFVQAYRCRRVLVAGVTLRNAPMWVIHPVLSSDVTVRGVKVISHGPNNDGCNPESCRRVLVEDALFDTGDDCIALKSGRNADGRRLSQPVEQVVVRRCQMRAGHGGITIGSEISGGARQVYAERCRLDSPDLERGLRLKTNTLRGGVIEDVFVRDIDIGQVQLAPIEIDLRYEPADSGPFLPVVRNILVERMTSARSQFGLFVRGLPQAPIRGLVVRDSVFRGVARGHLLEGAVDLTLSGVTFEAAVPEEKR